MPIDPSVALGAELPEVSFEWSASDAALYNLAVGAASDPMDTTGLEYIHDATPKVLPTFATVAAGFHTTEPRRSRSRASTSTSRRSSTAASR